jgi:hypothetical protein
MVDSENYGVFDSNLRSELLFELFRHVTVGGGTCQYDENVNPYMNATKLLYRRVVDPRKHKNTGAIMVINKVFKITGLDLSPASGEISQVKVSHAAPLAKVPEGAAPSSLGVFVSRPEMH